MAEIAVAVEDVVEERLSDEQIEQEVGIVAGRLAARRFAEQLGDTYVEE